MIILFFCLQISKLLVVGGDSPTHMAVRCINFLLANKMQLRFNRTGVRGKLNFSQVLEPIIKGKLLNCFLHVVVVVSGISTSSPDQIKSLSEQIKSWSDQIKSLSDQIKS